MLQLSNIKSEKKLLWLILLCITFLSVSCSSPTTLAEDLSSLDISDSTPVYQTSEFSSSQLKITAGQDLIFENIP